MLTKRGPNRVFGWQTRYSDVFGRQIKYSDYLPRWLVCTYVFPGHPPHLRHCSSSVEASRPTQHIIGHFGDDFYRSWPNQQCQSTVRYIISETSCVEVVVAKRKCPGRNVMTPREPSQRSVHTCFCTLCRVLKSTLMNRPIVTRTINSLCYMAPKIIYHLFFL